MTKFHFRTMSVIHREIFVSPQLSSRSNEANSIIEQFVKESTSKNRSSIIESGQKLFVEWPKIVEFTSERIGQEKIIEYIEKVR